jgi:multiple sugar transport system ATP-binding protein
VYDNMAFGLKLRRMPKAEIDRRVKEAAKVLGIDHLLTRRPKALSGGQRQRVALGRAIVREPKVFLMDEPLSNLDAKLRVQMRAEIIRLHQRLQTTFIYVTHDQTEAMTMGTRIVVMKDGFIQQLDSPQNLYNNPVNLFVAGFIGTPPMNFFDATLLKEGNNLLLKFGVFKIKIPSTRAAQIDQSFVDKDIIMGVRPEDIHDDPDFISKNPDVVITARVDVVELMGSETNLYLVIEGKEGTCTAVVDARSLSRTGDTIKIAIDLYNVHLFDMETEASIIK